MRSKSFVLGGITLLSCLILASPAAAQPEIRAGTVAAGAALGLQGDTADGTAFAVTVNGDYFLSHNISIGPLLQLGFTGDLTQVGVSLQGKLTVDVPEVPNLTPHVQAGIGFIRAHLDRGALPSTNDTSFLIPVGVGAAYYLSPRFALDSTVLLNFTDLDLARNENFFVTWVIGVKYHF